MAIIILLYGQSDNEDETKVNILFFEFIRFIIKLPIIIIIFIIKLVTIDTHNNNNS